MTGPEIVTFTRIVSSAYTANDFSDLLLSLNRNFLDYVAANVPFPQQVKELVGAANSQGWISQLVLAVLADRPNNQHIRAFLCKHPYWDPAKHPVLQHPADTLRVLGGRSFIARDKLRKALKKMDEPTGRKVLLVSSTHRKVGKTYSKDLVEFVSQNKQPSEVAYVDLDSEKFDPINLTKKIVKEMKLNASLFPDEATEQAARSNQELVKLLTEVDNPLLKVWWIILDGFREGVPSEAIQDFVAKLAQLIQSTEEFRLILVNYTCLIPFPVFTIKDDLEPLTRAELETHFANVHRQKHKTYPSPSKLSEYLSGMDEFFTEYTTQYPEFVGDQVLVNRAVTDIADLIEEEEVL